MHLHTGTLTMWLDILSVEDAKKYPVKNITPPPAEDWEVSYLFVSLLSYFRTPIFLRCRKIAACTKYTVR